ncbi:hypothetical protein EVAR_78282_1 [Eumeta japonica]|uniref:Uncharacterized protein n=1 Tax=Eumeta variegata TaxID=151549 RepID=A0A4C1T6K7_EUMVA|nr:hypothetical protein EVAR_78282_1 [Eumeta japonica]
MTRKVNIKATCTPFGTIQPSTAWIQNCSAIIAVTLARAECPTFAYVTRLARSALAGAAESSREYNDLSPFRIRISLAARSSMELSRREKVLSGIVRGLRHYDVPPYTRRNKHLAEALHPSTAERGTEYRRGAVKLECGIKF